MERTYLEPEQDKVRARWRAPRVHGGGQRCGQRARDNDDTDTECPLPGPPSLASYFWICPILAPSPPPSGAGPDHEPVWGTTSQSRSLGPIRQLSRQAALRMRRGLQSVTRFWRLRRLRPSPGTSVEVTRLQSGSEMRVAAALAPGTRVASRPVPELASPPQSTPHPGAQGHLLNRPGHVVLLL